MAVRLGDEAPNFTADSTEGKLDLHKYLGDSWGVLFSHPKDFTPVCTTELGRVAELKPEWDKRNVKVIGLSVDSTADHENWAKDIEEVTGHKLNYPVIGDKDFKVSTLYDMLPGGTSGDAKSRTPADNQTVRNVYVIGPDKKIKMILTYPMTCGRNFEEILRVIDSLQLNAEHSVATPADWKPGDDVIITAAVSNEDADKKFPGYKTVKPYLRTTAHPK